MHFILLLNNIFSVVTLSWKLLSVTLHSDDENFEVLKNQFYFLIFPNYGFWIEIEVFRWATLTWAGAFCLSVAKFNFFLTKFSYFDIHSTTKDNITYLVSRLNTKRLWNEK